MKAVVEQRCRLQTESAPRKGLIRAARLRSSEHLPFKLVHVENAIPVCEWTTTRSTSKRVFHQSSALLLSRLSLKTRKASGRTSPNTPILENMHSVKALLALVSAVPSALLGKAVQPPGRAHRAARSSPSSRTAAKRPVPTSCSRPTAQR
eukprot:1060583-Pleurochrysis_carterae.AAC.1